MCFGLMLTARLKNTYVFKMCFFLWFFVFRFLPPNYIIRTCFAALLP